MKVLVTGGAGFIGSFLCEELLDKGYDVVCLDNFSTGKESNVKHLLQNPKFKLIKHDVTKPIELETDFIFHLASPASPADYQKLPIETSMANSLGTFNMLNLAKKNESGFLLASTSEVYGEPLVHPQKEDYWGNVNPIGIRSCYNVSKRFAENLSMNFFREYSLNVRIARIFNTYGPRMRLDDGRVIPNFIVQSLTGKPISVYGDGKQTRSFCYILDMIDGLMKLMSKESLSGEVVNLGAQEERTILTVAELIKNITNSNSKIVFKPLPEDDPARRKPDITKAKKLLGWEPKVDLETGLEKTIEWFKEELKK
ncbi:MAG: SDR family oxidoreductase [Candidatus Aenigmarchaeota archaeon]|nr:SDR family oxidoreductase [Candidatus Aenigmarchaeota archaeon]